ncbi:MAG TPA: hypothetical protein PK096_02405 [Candidatus Saccharibacteria bacterium]|nr:hypothetical protein [Candidatus Saccharibacteria bacterium]HRK94196.1 hypothetical protein [Candidatus Saccharibacteria bacterium]
MRKQDGFALPTVMISSVVMLIVLLASLVAASSANTSIRLQYYDKLLAEAAEAGVAMANACLAKNNQVVTWSNANPLRPNTKCDGTTLVAGDLAPGQNIVSQYIVDTANIKTTFSVPAPIDDNGVQRVNATGTLTRYRTSNSATAGTSTKIVSALVGGQNSFSNVAFGYAWSNGGADQGAQFLVVLPTGEVKGVGRNNNARLGYWAGCGGFVGCVDNQTTPVTFALPAGEKGIAAYSSFLSLGTNVYVLTQSGKVYGAGNDDYEQLGAGAGGHGGIGNPTPVQYTLPGGVLGRFVATLGYSTFVMGSNNSIYAVGACGASQLGTGCSSGNVSTPTRVALPAVNINDTNTLPITEPGWVQPTNLTVDRWNGYVRMQGGAVYGWGTNDFGQLGNGTTTTSSTPIRIQATTHGNVYPNASQGQVAFNGTAFYMLDNDGRVWTAGDNRFGQQMGASSRLMSQSFNWCMQATMGVGGNISATTCSTNPASDNGAQLMEFWPDKTWRMRVNYTEYEPDGPANPGVQMYCINAPAALNGNVYLAVCNGSNAQKWTLNGNTIRSDSLGSNTCATSTSIFAPTVHVATCSGATTQNWIQQNNPWLRTVPRPDHDVSLGRRPKYVRITTDNGSVHLLDETGAVWAAGANNRGQLGIGTTPASSTALQNNVLRKVVLPNGSVVADLYNTEVDPGGALTGGGSASYNNAYFVLTNGEVWGTGSNYYGQMGNGSTAEYFTTPVKMNLPTGVAAKSIQAGYGTAVVISTGGKIYTVGNNVNGQLGDGTTTNSYTPKANVYTNLRTTLVY